VRIWCRQRGKNMSNPDQALLESVRSLYGHLGTGPGTLYEWLGVMKFEKAAQLIEILASKDEIQKIGGLYLQEVSTADLRSDRVLSSAVIQRSSDNLHERLLQAVGLSEDLEHRHPFERQLAGATVHAAITLHRRTEVELSAAVLTHGLIYLSAFILFAERRNQMLSEAFGSSEGANAAMANLRAPHVRKILKPGEVVLNAGTSFLLDGTRRGDGYLIITDQRFIFDFDHDYRKQPFILERSDITGIDFLPTSAVPMSEILMVGFKRGGYFEAVQMYVGHRFADELRQLEIK
jgi:hypothetical protein